MESPPKSQKCKTTSLFDEQEIARFLRDRQRNGSPAIMVDRYQRAIKSVQTFVANKYPLKASHILDWRESLLAAGYARNTVNCLSGAVNTYLAYAGYAKWRIPILPRRNKKQGSGTTDD